MEFELHLTDGVAGQEDYCGGKGLIDVTVTI